ncbi:MAG TPA: DoxX family protein [Gemmatimonadaceae bacterium]|nr:DoxX family protein [Gemmatimonadaceae bacterium]
MSATILDSSSRRASRARTNSPAATWAARILTGIAVLFLAFDAAIKLAGARVAVEGTTQLGWQPHHLPIIGTIAAVLLVLYAIPRTAPLGAILWTGYLGGAVATHLRVDNPLFSHILFPIYVAAILWGGLYLRDPRVRALIRP